MRVAIEDLMAKAEFAQEYLQVNGSKEVVQVCNIFCKIGKDPSNMWSI